MSKNNGYRHQIQDERLGRLEEKVSKILENHLPHLQNSIEEVAADVAWLKRFFWVIMTASIGSFIMMIFNTLH